MCKKRLTSDHEVVKGEMTVQCKKWLAIALLNMCRIVQNRAETSDRGTAIKFSVGWCVNHPRSANANDRIAADNGRSQIIPSALQNGVQYLWSKGAGGDEWASVTVS